MQKKSIKIVLLGLFLISLIALIAYIPNSRVKATQAAGSAHTSMKFFLPFIPIAWPPIPSAPQFNAVENDDQDNIFTISWKSVPNAETYRLEESLFPDFHVTYLRYSGSDLSWTSPDPGKGASTYYYRVRASNTWGNSEWATQTATIYPLFVGLKLQWDGTEIGTGPHLSGSYYTRWKKDFNTLVAPDVIQSTNTYWSDTSSPPSSQWYDEYVISTGEWLRSYEADANGTYFWGAPWKLGYTDQFYVGQIVYINDQAFTVTEYGNDFIRVGKSLYYWEFKNRDDFLYWEEKPGQDGLKIRCHPGEVILRYDAGMPGSNTRLLYYTDMTTRYIYNREYTNDYVRFIEHLTAANSFYYPEYGLLDQTPYYSLPAPEVTISAVSSGEEVFHRKVINPFTGMSPSGVSIP
ncbi:MAG TPA: hypothetical protein PKW33_02015 [Anaerolineaceae bacterium]|nr:hypothetical protein [Anaerolineaceae bacterium]HPN50335.1 hypothetical protein [Anaerolineaceae bacterium]